jgi:hypothetical protein
MADVSIEFGHFYCYPRGSGRLKAQLREARRTAWEAAHLYVALQAEGLSTSSVLMVDDVNEVAPWDSDDVLAAVDDWPLQPDYLVWESAMVPFVEPATLGFMGQPGEASTSPACKYLTMAFYLARLGMPSYEIASERLNRAALPFTARRLYTILPSRFMTMEAEIRDMLRASHQLGQDQLRWIFT